MKTELRMGDGWKITVKQRLSSFHFPANFCFVTDAKALACYKTSISSFIVVVSQMNALS